MVVSLPCSRLLVSPVLRRGSNDIAARPCVLIFWYSVPPVVCSSLPRIDEFSPYLLRASGTETQGSFHLEAVGSSFVNIQFPEGSNPQHNLGFLIPKPSNVWVFCEISTTGYLAPLGLTSPCLCLYNIWRRCLTTHGFGDDLPEARGTF